MTDLYSKVVLQVSNTEAVELLTNAGTPRGYGIDRVDRSKVFVPSDTMTMTELAGVFAVYINVKLSGQPLTPEEYEQLPSSVRKFFQDQ